MTLYELNQASYKTLPDMTEGEIELAIDRVCRFIADNANNYYMMLCHELRHYTLFTWKKASRPVLMAREVIDVLKSFGRIKAIELAGDHVEMWVQGEYDMCNMFVFFGYDKGVIKV